MQRANRKAFCSGRAPRAGGRRAARRVARSGMAKGGRGSAQLDEPLRARARRGTPGARGGQWGRAAGSPSAAQRSIAAAEKPRFGGEQPTPRRERYPRLQLGCRVAEVTPRVKRAASIYGTVDRCVLVVDASGFSKGFADWPGVAGRPSAAAGQQILERSSAGVLGVVNREAGTRYALTVSG